MRKKQTFPLFGFGFAVVPRLLGKGKDRGKNTSDRIARTNCSKECRDWPAVIGQSQLEINLARCWHTFGGRRIELPQGGATAASPFVCKNVGDCHALKACMCRTAVLKAHGEMKAHILVTICPDFGTWHSWLFRHTRDFVCEVTTSKKRTPKRHEFKTEPPKPNLLVRNTFLPTLC